MTSYQTKLQKAYSHYELFFLMIAGEIEKWQTRNGKSDMDLANELAVDLRLIKKFKSHDLKIVDYMAIAESIGLPLLLNFDIDTNQQLRELNENIIQLKNQISEKNKTINNLDEKLNVLFEKYNNLSKTKLT